MTKHLTYINNFLDSNPLKIYGFHLINAKKVIVMLDVKNVNSVERGA